MSLVSPESKERSAPSSERCLRWHEYDICTCARQILKCYTDLRDKWSMHKHFYVSPYHMSLATQQCPEKNRQHNSQVNKKYGNI